MNRFHLALIILAPLAASGTTFASAASLARLPYLSTGSPYSTAYGLNGRGDTPVGYSRAETSPQAVRWLSNGSMQPLPVLSGNSIAFATDASDNGFVTGYAATSYFQTPTSSTTAFRWTTATGTIALANSPEGNVPRRALGMSDNGFVIVGGA